MRDEFTLLKHIKARHKGGDCCAEKQKHPACCNRITSPSCGRTAACVLGDMIHGEKRNAGAPLLPLPVRTAGSSPVRTSRPSQNANTNRSRRGDSYNNNIANAWPSNHDSANENESRDDEHARGIVQQTNVGNRILLPPNNINQRRQRQDRHRDQDNSPAMMRRRGAPPAAEGGLNWRRSENGVSTTSDKVDGGGGGGLTRSAAELRGRVGVSGVDRGLASIGLSMSSSLWALPPPPSPSGHAVPALLSHLAGRWLCSD